MKRTAHQVNHAFEIQLKAITASCRAYDAGDKWEALRLSAAVYTLLHDHGPIRSVLTQLGLKDELVFLATGKEIKEATREKFHTSTCLIELWRDESGDADFVPLCTYYDKKSGHLKKPYRFMSRVLTFKEWWEDDIIYFDLKTEKPTFVVDFLGRIPHKPKSREAQTAIKRARTEMEELVSKNTVDDGIPDGKRITLTRRQLVASLRNQDGGGHFDPELRNDNYISLTLPSYIFSYPKLNVCVNRELAMMRQIAEELRLTFASKGLYSDDAIPRPVGMLVSDKDGKWHPMSSLPKLLKDAENAR